jgi:hypothetical protein
MTVEDPHGVVHAYEVAPWTPSPMDEYDAYFVTLCRLNFYDEGASPEWRCRRAGDPLTCIQCVAYVIRIEQDRRW